MSELTSVILISCHELVFVGRCLPQVWRIIFDSQLSVILTKIEKIHEKLIRLNVVGPMKLKMNHSFKIGFIVNVTTIFLLPIVWTTVHSKHIRIIEMVIIVI